jgi:hypothetical protein
MPKKHRRKPNRTRQHEARANGLAIWRTQDAAERLAVPAVSYGPTPGQVRHRITVETAGHAVVIEAREPTCSARSDQMAVSVDGAVCDELMGITALLALVGKQLPRQPSRKAVRDAEIADTWGSHKWTAAE